MPSSQEMDWRWVHGRIFCFSKSGCKGPILKPKPHGHDSIFSTQCALQIVMNKWLNNFFFAAFCQSFSSQSTRHQIQLTARCSTYANPYSSLGLKKRTQVPSLPARPVRPERWMYESTSCIMLTVIIKVVSSSVWCMQYNIQSDHSPDNVKFPDSLRHSCPC